MATTENGTGTVAESTENPEAAENERQGDEELVVKNRHQTILPVDDEKATDAGDIGPAENRHQTSLPAD